MKRAISIGVLAFPGLMTALGDAGITAPGLGYVYESASQALRAVNGTPGAALLGPVLATGIGLADATVSPDQSYALGIAAEDRTVILFVLRNGAATPRAIEGPVHADRIVLSPEGRSAVLYDAAARSLQIVTGLPDAPAPARKIDCPAPGAIAISDDGQLLLVAGPDALQPLLLFDSSGQAGNVPLPGPVSAMLFRPQSHDALIAGGGRLTLIHDVETGTGYQDLGEEAGSPVAFGFLREGRTLVAAYSDGLIRTRDLASGESSAVPCPCVPTGLFPMNGNAVFRLNESGAGPLFLFDGAKNRVVFVPRGNE